VCATALFLIDLLERWEMMWDLLKIRINSRLLPFSHSVLCGCL
jgi:hypothetical protein